MASGELQQQAEVNIHEEVLKRTIEATERGLELKTMDDFWRYAVILVRAGMVPKEFLGSVEKTFVAITFGAELGLSPWMALNSVAMINGRPRLWGDALLGLCIKSGLFDHRAFRVTVDGDGQARKAVVTVRRKPDGNPITKEFSIADAARGGLLGRETPWKTFPDVMLESRAKTFALRLAFADVLMGIPCAEHAEPQAASLEDAGLVVPRPLDVLAADLEKKVLAAQSERVASGIQHPDDELLTHAAAKKRIKDKAANALEERAAEPVAAANDRGLFS